MPPVGGEFLSRQTFSETAMKKPRSATSEGSDQCPVQNGLLLEKKKLVVIGAGFAGLAAARTVVGTAGERVEVIVLEASSYLGGRARAGRLPSGAHVEMGATWFHGVCANPLYEIAVWEGLALDLRGDPDLRKHQVDWQVDFAQPMGHQLLKGRFREVAEEALERFQEGAIELSEGSQAPDVSVGAFLRRKFDEAVKDKSLSTEELAVFAESWLFREKQQRSFDGFFCADDVSCAFPSEFETLEGPNMPVPGGLQAIAQSLADPLDIRYNHTVTAIEWGTGGVCVSCSNGVEIEADAVLVTTSIGVLQAKHQSLFLPPLPDWKQSAISAMRLGVVDKVFLEFEIDHAAAAAAAADPSASSHLPSAKPVAQKQSETGGVIEDPWNMGRRGLDADLVAASAAQATAAAMVASSSSAAPGRASRSSRNNTRRSRPRKTLHTYAFMWPVPEPLSLGTSGTTTAQSLLPGGLVHSPQPGSHLLGLPSWLYGLHSIRFSPGPCWIEPSEKDAYNAMIAGEQGTREKDFVGAVLWITGDAALEMEGLDEDELQSGILQLLHMFPSIPLPPHAKMPPKVVRTTWGRDDHFLGSYSYLRAGVEDGEAIDVIAEPLCAEDGTPVVLFAGEATHRQYPGTAHGAYLSGFREANRFIEAMNQQDSLMAFSLAASTRVASADEMQHEYATFASKATV